MKNITLYENGNQILSYIDINVIFWSGDQIEFTYKLDKENVTIKSNLKYLIEQYD